MELFATTDFAGNSTTLNCVFSVNAYAIYSAFFSILTTWGVVFSSFCIKNNDIRKNRCCKYYGYD